MFDWKFLVPLLLGTGVLTSVVEITRLIFGRKKGKIDAAASLTTSALDLSTAYVGQVDFLEERLKIAHDEITALTVKLKRANTKIEEQEERLRKMGREITELKGVEGA